MFSILSTTHYSNMSMCTAMRMCKRVQRSSEQAIPCPSSTMGNIEGGLAIPSPATSVSFTLNGGSVRVEDVSPSVSLNQWLRSQPGLTGTKRMCAEGGCGTCVVTATLPNQTAAIAINSCLCPMYSIEGWTITTIEGIGSSKAGFHPIQSAIADHNGSQCGYCTPGFVMSMYSLLQNTPRPTEREVEDIFDGNICRCTGYRPILDAMKSFACDHTPSTGHKHEIPDIEDLSPRVCSDTGGNNCVDLCKGQRSTTCDPKWYRPSSLSELVAVVRGNQGKGIKLLAGDTGRGVFKDPPSAEVVIDLKAIPELTDIKTTPSSLSVGACVTISKLARALDTTPSLKSLSQHLLKIGNVPVRNVGTWAGNLIMVHQHRDFPSDVFTVLAGLGAKVTLGHLSDLSTTEVTLWEFLETDISQSMVLSLSLPVPPEGVVCQSFKIMPRAVNSHAYVNASFSAELGEGCVVKTTPTFVYGGLADKPVLMSALSDYLVGKSLSDPATLKGAVEILSSEVVVVATPLAASPEYRKSLATTLFYKFVLSVLPKPLPPSLQCVVDTPPRPVSQGKQLYTSKPSEYPLTQPITKLTAKLQASGEAQYISDYPILPNELAAAFVLSSVGNAEIVSIDCSKAKTIPGFVKLLTAKDIPGVNNFMSDRDADIDEEVFAEKVSQYAGQPVALVLADTQAHADRLAREVVVTHKSLGPPILTLEEAIAEKSFFTSPARRVTTLGDAEAAISSADHVTIGQVQCGAQYHYHLETQTAVVIPDEGGFKVHSATQWVDRAQAAVANVLDIPQSSVDVSVKRIGGAYGAKTTRPNLVSAACALGASVTGRPVRMLMDLDTNMKVMGKRFPYLAKYKVASTKKGVITAIDVEVYADCGITPNENSISVISEHIDNAYFVPNWRLTTQACKTNTPTNLFCRSPGTVPGIFIMETMIDHLATSLAMDPEAVRAINLYKDGQMSLVKKELSDCRISSMWKQLYESAQVSQRKQEIAEYNKTNRWHKRGLSMVPIKYNINWMVGAPYNVTVNIYAEDGTVAIAHGGVEIGQGINTKVAQVASKELGVPMEMIRIKPTDSMLNPNGVWTGGSITSELNCLGTLRACKELNSRLDTVREQIPGLEWKDLIQMCSGSGVNLSARSFVNEQSDGKYNYVCYGCAVTEVSVDVLTGETRIDRVDILYDCGDSVNPEIDIGQVEGAFTMGLGYWLSEKIIHHPETGELLTHNTWEYKPPSSKDIPVDFRVELLKDASNPAGVLGSKAVGEPPQCMSCSVLFAIKRAVETARADIGVNTHFTLDGPATVENIQRACLVYPDGLVLS